MSDDAVREVSTISHQGQSRLDRRPIDGYSCALKELFDGCGDLRRRVSVYPAQHPNKLAETRQTDSNRFGIL